MRKPFAKPKTCLILIVALGLVLSGCSFSEKAFQVGNSGFVWMYHAQPSEQIANNWIGDTYSGITSTTPYIPSSGTIGDVSNDLGYKLVRLSFSEFSGDSLKENHIFSPTQFGEFEDRLIDHVNERGIAVLYNLTYFDPGLPVEGDYTRFQNEAEIQAYLDYARTVVTHFKGRIQYYETWNEPDLGHVGQQSIPVQTYIEVVRRLVPVIREADPAAKIIVQGGTELRQDFVQAYLDAIVSSDVVARVDGISIHPMYGASPDFPELKDYYENYDQIVRRYQKTAREHGFTGRFFAEEMCWLDEEYVTPDNTWFYTPLVRAKYYARGIVINLGLGVAAGIGGVGMGETAILMRMLRNLDTAMAGLEAAGIPVEITGEATESLRWYGFSGSDGLKVLAIWDDAVAVDDDPGAPVDLELSGVTAKEVTAVDVLNGIQQRLNFEPSAGALTLKGVIVRDYPLLIFIR